MELEGFKESVNTYLRCINRKRKDYINIKDGFSVLCNAFTLLHNTDKEYGSQVMLGSLIFIGKKDGMFLKRILSILFTVYYKFFPKISINLIPILEEIQYTKIYFSILQEINFLNINVKMTDYAELKDAILNYCAYKFKHIVNGMNEYSIDLATDPSTVILPEQLKLLKTWNRHFPTEEMAEFGNGKNNKILKKRRILTNLSNIVEELKDDHRLTINQPPNFYDYFDFGRKLFSVLIKIELYKIRKELDNDKFIQESIDFANKTIHNYAFKKSFCIFAESPEYESFIMQEKYLNEMSILYNIEFYRLKEEVKSTTYNSLYTSPVFNSTMENYRLTPATDRDLHPNTITKQRHTDETIYDESMNDTFILIFIENMKGAMEIDIDFLLAKTNLNNAKEKLNVAICELDLLKDICTKKTESIETDLKALDLYKELLERSESSKMNTALLINKVVHQVEGTVNSILRDTQKM